MNSRPFRLLATAPLAALALACGATSSQAPASTPAPSPQTVNITETEFSLSPSSLQLKAGKYVFHLVDSGKFPHDLHIVDSTGKELGAGPAMTAGGSEDVQVDLKAGTYTMFCGVSNHRQRGMEGTITVS